MSRPAWPLVLALFCTSAAAQSDVVEEAKLLAPDGGKDDRAGLSVAVAGDTAVVGVPRDDDNGGDSGSAHVFRRGPGGWAWEAKLLPTDGDGGDRFGSSVSISADRILVGAPEDDDAGGNSGSAYVFLRTGTTWAEQAKLAASDAAGGDRFGSAVSISGLTAIVGAPEDDDLGGKSGSAYLFVSNGSVWGEFAKLNAADGANDDLFGSSVSLGNGVAAIGAPEHADTGSAYVFRRIGGAWLQEAELLASDGVGGDLFGTSVALQGALCVVGAPEHDELADKAGAAYVFAFDGASWNEEQELLAPDGAKDDRLGSSVGLDGEIALAGAPRHDHAGGDFGGAYVFVRGGTSWSGSELLPASTAGGARFGSAAAISGCRAVVGAFEDDELADKAGAVHAFAIDTGRATYCTAKVNSCGTTPAISAEGVPSALSTSGFVVRGSNARGPKANGHPATGILIYGDMGRRIPATPFGEGGSLCVNPPVRRSSVLFGSGGTTGLCDAALEIDMNAFAHGLLGGNPQAYLLVPGTIVDCQIWGRDTASHGSYVSDALEYSICP